MSPIGIPGRSQREWSPVHDWIRLFGFTAGGWGRFYFPFDIRVPYVGVLLPKIVALAVAVWVPWFVILPCARVAHPFGTRGQKCLH